MSEISHGIWEEIEITKPHGKTLGTATVKMDSHTLAYLLKGQNCRVDAYETMERGGPMADDDVVSSAFTTLLRNRVESTRNKTLAE